MEQGLHKLEAKERKKNSLKAELLAYIVYPLPLTNFFNFNLSFLILLDVISDYTPAPFL